MGTQENNKDKIRLDEKLKTIVVVTITSIWAISVIVSLFFPSRELDVNVTAMMGSVVGYYLVDKWRNGGSEDNDKN